MNLNDDVFLIFFQFIEKSDIQDSDFILCLLNILTYSISKP